MVANWIVPSSPPERLSQAYQVTNPIIAQYEELLQKGLSVDIETLLEDKKEKKYADVKLVYETGREYLETFLPLIKAEKE